MKIISALALAIACILSSDANAFSIKTYKATVLEYENADASEQPVKLLPLFAYHQGIAESVTTILDLNNHVIMNQGQPFICVPESATVDANMIAGLMRQELRNPKFYPKLFGEKWESIPAFQLALTGLWRTFPCSKPQSKVPSPKTTN